MADFETYRPLLFSIAYRMLGSAMDAEDIVQETFIRYQEANPEQVEHPKAFLSTIVTRLCLNQLQSARVQREQYIGPWLPEPVITGGDGAALFNPASELGTRDTISMAFLVLLESLSPSERAVFLLREVFDYDYAEIARILDKDEAACRQLFSRAKKHVTENRPRFKATPEEHNQLLGQFLLACNVGDVEGLTKLLAENVTSWSDGGGKAQAATRPIHGADSVARFFIGLTKKMPTDAGVEITDINGKLGVLVRLSGKPFVVITLEVGDGLIREFRVVANPEKLARL